MSGSPTNAPGVPTPAKVDLARGGRIPHKKILDTLVAMEPGCADLAGIYREKVLPIKTRTIQLLGRKGSARIMTTLLGYEVQSARKRIQCPDLVTARYLKLFMELGCRSIRLPYDPTVTAALVPQFEAALQGIGAEVRRLFPRDRALQLYVTRRIYRIIRARLRARPAPPPAPAPNLFE